MTAPPRSLRLAFTATDREIGRLALPALGALTAEPLYVLADTAVVGHLGTEPLGGLSLAGTALLTFFSVMIFLAYGTTAAVSRLIGAGEHRSAAEQAVQGIWLAVGLGIVGAAALWLASGPLLRLLGGDGEILRQGRIYLRISVLGLPAMLVALAGVGYLRGLQDTVRPLVVALGAALFNLVLEVLLIFRLDCGIGASALSTVVAQWIAAGFYLWWIATAVRRHGVSLLPHPRRLLTLGRVAGDLFLRTVALRGSFTLAVAVAARIDDASLGAYEITFQLWYFTALALDAVAIAAQSMIGRTLGACDVAGTRVVGTRVLQLGLAMGLVAAVVLAALQPVLPELFSDDTAVIGLTAFLMWHLVLMQPLAGVVFALDGVLIGAGDMRYLAVATTAAAAAFLGAATVVLIADLGVGWVWGAVWVLMIVRAATLLLRFRGDGWLVPGAVR